RFSRDWSSDVCSSDLNAFNGYQADQSGGLHLNLATEFTRGGENETKLEIGHTGQGSYAIEFSNLSPLAIRKEDGLPNTQNAYIKIGRASCRERVQISV